MLQKLETNTEKYAPGKQTFIYTLFPQNRTVRGNTRSSIMPLKNEYMCSQETCVTYMAVIEVNLTELL